MPWRPRLRAQTKGRGNRTLCPNSVDTAIPALTFASTTARRSDRPGRSRLLDGVGGLPVLVTGFVMVHLGISPVLMMATDLIVGAAPAEKAGSAAAMSPRNRPGADTP